jgi:hypothetical protein
MVIGDITSFGELKGDEERTIARGATYGRCGGGERSLWSGVVGALSRRVEPRAGTTVRLGILGSVNFSKCLAAVYQDTPPPLTSRHTQ